MSPPKLPKSFYVSLFIFFESEFGSIPKNSGLNPWSFEFWRYPRLEPRAKLPPPPLNRRLDLLVMMIDLAFIDLAFIDLAFSLVNLADSKHVN